MASQSGVEWAGARNVGEEILHLVGEDASAFKVDVFRVGRYERYGDELHRRLFGRAPTFEIVAATAGRCDITPSVSSALRNRRDVITRKVARWKTHRTIEAQVSVSFEQRAIVQWWNILITIARQALACSVCCDDGIDVNLAALAIVGAVAAEHRVEKRAAIVGDLFCMIKAHSFPVVDPLKWHSGYISSQYLLRNIGSYSSEHWHTLIAVRLQTASSVPYLSKKSTTAFTYRAFST